MFDIGWPELLVIGTILIVVVGPKDLPPMLRAFGRTMAKVRGMASEFRSQFDDALRDAELDEVRKVVDDVRDLNPKAAMGKAMSPFKEAGRDVRKALDEAGEDDFEPFDTPVMEPLDPVPPATDAMNDAPKRAGAGGVAAASGEGVDPSAGNGGSGSGPKKPTAVPAAKSATTSAGKTPSKPSTKAAGKASAKPRAGAKPRLPGTKARGTASGARKPVSTRGAAADAAKDAATDTASS